MLSRCDGKVFVLARLSPPYSVWLFPIDKSFVVQMTVYDHTQFGSPQAACAVHCPLALSTYPRPSTGHP
jgi:hypothetical protein